MTQWFRVIKIAGKAALEVERHFRAAFQTENENEVTALLERLHANAHQPPVVFIREWVDMWSAGYVHYQHTHTSNPLNCGSYRLLILRPGHSKDVIPRLKRRQRKRNMWSDERYFNQALLDALDSYDSFTPWRIFVLREVLGVCVADTEVRASMKTLPEWLKGFHATSQVGINNAQQS